MDSRRSCELWWRGAAHLGLGHPTAITGDRGPGWPLLQEDNTRAGFFEPEPFASMLAHLPAALQPVIEFAYIT